MKHSEYVNQQHDVFDLLQKLSDLHKQNVLTDEEFKEKKDEILSKI
jgi:predicted DNA-binding ArsR family transcriptional regulator